jgi:hypothetical protein
MDLERANVSNGVLMQAPDANANTVFFGTDAEQPFELRARGSATLEVKDLKDIYVKGTSPDKLSILLY